MRGKQKTLFVLALLLLVGLTSGYVASTYAKYASEIKDNNGTATVAKWSFDTDNEKQTLEINLAEAYDASTLHDKRIAPGTEGSFDIALVNTNTETGVDYTIKLNDIANVPTNLKFYKDEAHSTELTPGTSTITGKLAPKDSTGVSVPIYWKWEFGDSNEVSDTRNVADTSDGKSAAALTIGVDITGVQTKPVPSTTPAPEPVTP